MKSKRLSGMLILVIIALLMLGNTGDDIYEVHTSLPVPTINYPSGNIRTRLPLFSWAAEASATAYQIQVKLDPDIVYTEDVDLSNCDATECTFYPLTVLQYQTYDWQVRADYGGSWSSWSPAETFRTLKPFLRMPDGVIVDQTPRFVWTKEYSADSYKIQVMQGDRVVHSSILSSPTCGATNCLYTLMEELPVGIYAWSLRALAGGVWGSWSGPTSFIVKQDPSFMSEFNTDMNGWKAVSGQWGVVGGSALKSGGVDNVLASVYYQDANFANLRYQVKMKRAGTDCSDCNNGIYIRGQVTPFSPGGYQAWNKGYFFLYANNGYFQVLKYNNGESIIQGPTYAPSINTYGWNTLRVDAKGSSLQFYINNVLVWSGTDTTHTIGKVGIAFYQINYPGDTLYVDWAGVTYWNP